ncbi:MAG: hypothetical protein IJ950_08405, partial [Helicobacter sp.]|nr:hypothetical protein [Helicobacter sp.]
GLVPLLRRVFLHILHGGSLVVLTDTQRQWFSKYITQNINLPSKTRPFFPIFEVESLGFMIDMNLNYNNTPDRHFGVINKMLEHSFAKNYMLWYIGKKTIRGDFALFPAVYEPFMWLIDGQDMPTKTIRLSSLDDLLDYKLLQLYRLFERALCGVVFGQISLELS